MLIPLAEVATTSNPVVALSTALLSGVGVVVAQAVFRAYRTRGLPKVEVTEKIQQMALDFITPLDTRLHNAERTIDTLQARVEELNKALDAALARARHAEHRADVYGYTLTRHEIPLPLTT